MPKLTGSFARLLLVLLPACIAVGCEKADEKKPPSQVAAKVNAEEITVHQVNDALAKIPNIPPEATTQAMRQILDRLIEQELARKKAVENKLDRTPSFLRAVEAAKNEILSRAYSDHVAALQPQPTAEEIKKFYSSHPALFAERRVLDLEEIAVQLAEGLAAGLQELTAKGATKRELVSWLTLQDAKFTESRGLRSAEQIPLDLLPKLQEMKPGDLRLIEYDGRLGVYRVMAVKAEPATEAQAAPWIQQFLFNQRLRETMAKEMKQLKVAAKIEYIGEFAGKAAPLDKPAAKPAPVEETKSPAPNVEKGIRGLR